MTGDGNVIGANDDGSSQQFIRGVDGGNHLVEANTFNTYPPTITDDEWHFIAYLKDGNQAFVYTYGDLVGEETPSGDPDPRLERTPGLGTTLHTVYFGESFDEVDSAAG